MLSNFLTPTRWSHVPHITAAAVAKGPSAGASERTFAGALLGCSARRLQTFPRLVYDGQGAVVVVAVVLASACEAKCCIP
jgi:hypothetical protein